MKTLQVYGEDARSIRIWLEVNNGMHLEMSQASDDGIIEVRRMDGDTTESAFTVSAGDMVTMLNWFRFQKCNGNINLEFSDYEDLKERYDTLYKNRHTGLIEQIRADIDKDCLPLDARAYLKRLNIPADYDKRI